MDTNPYKYAEGAKETPPARGLVMRQRLIWFAIGFAVSWGSWSAISYVRARPGDITQSWPQESRDVVPPELDWIKEVQARKLGRVVVIVPADPQNASAMVSPLPPNQFPQVAFHDEGADGRVDWIAVNDASRRCFSIDVADGRFTSYNYSTDLADDSITYRDGNMDGQFDYRFGSEGKGTILVNGQWRDYVQDGDTRYVDLNGTPAALKLIDGVWQITSED